MISTSRWVSVRTATIVIDNYYIFRNILYRFSIALQSFELEHTRNWDVSANAIVSHTNKTMTPNIHYI